MEVKHKMGDTANAIIGCCCIGIIIFLVLGFISGDNNSSDVTTPSSSSSSSNPSVSQSQNPSTDEYSTSSGSSESGSTGGEEGEKVTVTIEDLALADDGGSFGGSDYAILVPEGKTYMIGLEKADYETIVKMRGYNPVGKKINIQLGSLRSDTGNAKIYDYNSICNEDWEPVSVSVF